MPANNDAIAMLSPLVAGRAYAANLATEGAIEAVGELWGQSEPCGPVDERGILYTMDSDGGHLHDGPLSSAAFYVNNGDHAGAWNCAVGTRTEVDRAMRYDLTGIRRLGACPAPGAAGSARIVWNQTSNTATLTSSLPGISGADLYVSGSCWQQHCDLNMRGPDRVNWQFAADVGGDLGLNTPTLASADFPLHGATVFVSQRDQPISIACATGGRVRRNADTRTITLDISGLGTLSSCAGGTAATPSERSIFVR